MGKLLKHELRSYMKTFLPLWGAVLAMGLVNGLTWRATENSLAFFSGVLPKLVLFALLLATGVLTLVLVLQRFFRGLLGSEGYLVFTLPLTRREILGAKLISAVITELLSGLVAILCGVLLISFINSFEGWSVFPEFLWDIIRIMKEKPEQSWLTILLFFELFLLLIFGMTEKTLHFYAAMALGHLGKNHRVALSVIAYVGLNAVGSSLLLRLGVHFSEQLLRLGSMLVESEAGACGLLGLVLLGLLVVCGVLWTIARVILDKHLNLE